MTLHNLSAGSGYEYLARQVGAMDSTEKGHATLADFTLREEVPGDVWTAGRASAKPSCVTPPKMEPTYIEVTVGRTGPAVASELAPLEASLLRSGACEATLEMFVPDVKQYRVTIGGAGDGKFDPADIQNADHSIKVTIAG